MIPGSFEQVFADYLRIGERPLDDIARTPADVAARLAECVGSSSKASSCSACEPAESSPSTGLDMAITPAGVVYSARPPRPSR